MMYSSEQEAIIRHLRTFISRMEHRYEYSSLDMKKLMSTNPYYNTAEIRKWMEKVNSLEKACSL